LPDGTNTVFSVAGIGRMRKTYCKCGRIIGLDSSQVDVKIHLGKDLECSVCRNARISREIDDMNNHFNNLEEPIL
jgi:hypothetical protein